MVVSLALAAIAAGCVPAGPGDSEGSEATATMAPEQTEQALAEETPVVVGTATPEAVGCAVPDPALLTLEVDLGTEQEQALDGASAVRLKLHHRGDGAGTAIVHARVMTETEWRDFEVGQAEVRGAGDSEYRVNVARLALPTDTGAMAGELGFYVRYSGEDGEASTPRQTVSFHHDGQSWRVYADAARKQRYADGALSEDARRAVALTDTKTVQWTEDEQGNPLALSPPSFVTVHVTTSPLQ